MVRRRLKGPKNWTCDWCEDIQQVWLDCRLLPHGVFSLIPTVVSSMAFWTAIVQDGCDFAKLEGGKVEMITKSDVLPFLEVGLSHYRAPLYYPNENEWKLVFTDSCKDYSNDDRDLLQVVARWLAFTSTIIGGALTLFLWFLTCFSFSIRTWRFCAAEAILAAMLRSGSFLFLLSQICTENVSNCSLSFGSRMDVIGTALWLTVSLAMFGHYPEPKLRTVQFFDKDEDNEDLLRVS